jgi:hypothetical protein
LVPTFLLVPSRLSSHCDGGIQYVEHTEGDGGESGPRAWLSKFIAVMQIKHLV